MSKMMIVYAEHELLGPWRCCIIGQMLLSIEPPYRHRLPLWRRSPTSLFSSFSLSLDRSSARTVVVLIKSIPSWPPGRKAEIWRDRLQKYFFLSSIPGLGFGLQHRGRGARAAFRDRQGAALYCCLYHKLVLLLVVYRPAPWGQRKQSWSSTPLTVRISC